MVTPPEERLELVLMADEDAPVHIWIQSPAHLANAFLVLVGIMVIFPLHLFKAVGFWCGK